MDITYSEKKLGRGLSSLLGESKLKPSSGLQNQSTVEKINITKITSGIYQPRKRFDEEDLLNLSQSIKENGVIQPIILRKKEDEDRYEIIAGERRFLASQLAKLQEIPAIVKKISNREALEIALIENIQRSDLSVIEEAGGYQRLIDEFSYTQEVVAQKVGKSRSHITNLLRLLNLPKKVLDYLDNKDISMGHARAIINSNNPESIAKKIIEKSLNVRETENLVRDEKIEKIKISTPHKNKSDTKLVSNDQLINLEKQISELMDLEIKISYNSFKGTGKISAKFDNLEKIRELKNKFSK